MERINPDQVLTQTSCAITVEPGADRYATIAEATSKLNQAQRYLDDLNIGVSLIVNVADVVELHERER